MFAVEMPATDFYCRDGVLYFLLRGYGEYSLSKEQEGIVFSYDGRKLFCLDMQTKEIQMRMGWSGCCR